MTLDSVVSKLVIQVREMSTSHLNMVGVILSDL